MLIAVGGGLNRVPNRLQDEDLVASLELGAGITPGLLVQLLSLEADFPDLNARGARRELFRTVETILDADADRTDAP